MTERVQVDHRRCRRHALCVIVAPDVFARGGDGRMHVTQPASADAAARAREAERYCPLQAIDTERRR